MGRVLGGGAGTFVTVRVTDRTCGLFVTPVEAKVRVPGYVPAFMFEETLTVTVAGVIAGPAGTDSHWPSIGLVETAMEKLSGGPLLLTRTCCEAFPFPEPC